MKRSQDDISNAKASEIQRDASRQEQTAYKLSASQIHSFSPSEMQNFVNSIKNSKIQLRVVNPASLTSKDPSPPTSPPLEPPPPKPTTQITSWLNSPPPDTALQTLPLYTHTTNLVNFPLINKKPKRRKRYHIPLRNIVNYNNNILYDNYTMDNLTHNNNNNDIDIPYPSSQPTNPSPEEETTEPTAPIMSLPSVNEDSLDKLLDLVSHCHTAANREKMSAAITRQGYIRQLLDLFIKCEQARNLPKLQCLFNIFKSLIMLNETSLLEFLFSEEYMLDVIGALEYDPELKKRIKHREFLKEHAIFKQVVPIRKAELITRIHQTFRLQYLKDVVLPRQLDDTTFSTINSLIFFNQVEIVSQIQSDDVFLSELFALLKQDVQNLPQPQTTSINNNNNAIPQESQPIKDRILFVQELCTLAKNLHVQSRLSFFETLYRHGVCDVLQVTVLHQDTGIRLATVNILDNMATHDSGLLRSHILAQKNETPPYQLLMNVIKAFLYDHESGIRVQLNDIIRSLLDVANIVDTPEKDEFLNVFYIDPITTLLEPFNKEEGVYEDSVKENICDILSFCVQHHGYRIKYFILGNNIVPKILNLLKRKEKHLVLAAIRFFRTFVGLKDDFYNRHVTKFNLFDPIMQTFKDNGPRYNLINSAIIELLEFIRKENIKHLILHIAEHYKPILSEVTYVETCKLLLLKAEQLQEATTPGTTPVASKTVTPSRFQTDEEDYFKEDDQEPARPPNNSPEQGHAISTRPKLVDYDDIDIDDSDTSSDNEPPPTTNGPRLTEEENSLKRKEVEAPSIEPPIPKPAAAEDEADTTILKKKPKISINIKPVTSTTTTESEPTSNSESESNSPKKQDT